MNDDQTSARPDNFLLLRGLGRHQKHWGGFDARMAEGLGIKVHCLDLPGFGTEHERKATRSVPSTTSDLRERWQDLKGAHPGSWGLLAISLGGMVAMDWCATHDEDFDGLVLINTSARDLGRPWERMRPSTLTQLLNAARMRDVQARERLVLIATSERRDDLDETSAKNAQLEREFAPMKVGNVLRQLGAASRYRAPAGWQAPTLILASKGDRLASHKCSERLAQRVGAALKMHPSAGHDLPRDEPSWVIDQLAKRFVTS